MNLRDKLQVEYLSNKVNKGVSSNTNIFQVTNTLPIYRNCFINENEINFMIFCKQWITAATIGPIYEPKTNYFDNKQRIFSI